MRYVFIINPTAGKGKGVESIIPKINEYFSQGEKPTVYITEQAGQAKSLAKAEAELGGEVRIFACGGEGTCFEVLNGVYGYKNVELGVIPCGSANDFLKFFGDKAPFFDIEQQVNGESIEIDLIKADEFYCINGCSVGMDAMVADSMKLFKRLPLVSGSMAYTLALVKTLFARLGVQIKLTVNGVEQKAKKCMFVVCANGPIYGGGYKAAPDATPMDGKLDFTVIDAVSKLKIPKLIGIYKRGEHRGLPICEMGRCERLLVEADREVPINLDGEIIHRKSIFFEIVEGGIKFVLPRQNMNNIIKKKEFSQTT